MSIFEPARPPWPSRMLGVLRIVAALLFMLHGMQKIFGIPAGSQPPMPFRPLSQMGVAGTLEFFGGVGLLLGVYTRPIAFLVAGEMAVAYFQAHFPHSVFPVLNGGDAPVLFCFIFLFLTVAGAGEWSVDAAIAGSRRSNAGERVLLFDANLWACA